MKKLFTAIRKCDFETVKALLDNEVSITENKTYEILGDAFDELEPEVSTSDIRVYSHCFGRVTSGFNFECEEGEFSVIKPSADIEDVDNTDYSQDPNYYNSKWAKESRDLSMNVFAFSSG